MPSRHLVHRALVLALILVVTAGMGCRTRSSEDAAGRVLLLGLDGLDPLVVDQLIAEDALPNFARLRQGGAYGKLRAEPPLLSPILWTTIATGRRPEDHGIGHFVAVNPQTGEQLPVTSQMRRTRALWNIASDAGREVAVVGWWATWPPEAVRGAIVSDHTAYHFLFEEGVTGKNETVARTHPPELDARIARMLRRPADLALEDVLPFANVSAQEFARPFTFEDDLAHFKWALSTAWSYRDIGLDLWKKDRPDLGMIYIEGTDSTSHLFGHLHRAEGLVGELAEQQRRFGGTVEAMYGLADEIVGAALDALDEQSTLVVLSDHGFELGVLPDDPSKTRDMRRVSERHHRTDGILYLYGRGVREAVRLDQPTQYDVTPTVLALLGLPASAEMPGRVLQEGLHDGIAPPARIASHETGTPGGATEAGDAPVRDPEADRALLEQMRSLGYLQTESPRGDRNLAAIQFQQGRFAEAARIYKQLLEASPDDAGLRTSLAGALGALGRLDEAKVELERAVATDPVNPEAHHNLGVIHERQGDTNAAVDRYRTALRYAPGYEPSRASLLRLTGSADASPARDDAERLATLIANQASDLARRGDYLGAHARLDEAERVAPRFALVHQYRSNIAYLQGDRTAAIRALERALELEPDNALYAQNLRALRQQGAGRR